MRIACWNIPPLDPLEALLRRAGDEVFRSHPYGCTRALEAGEVDAALVPLLDLLLRAGRWLVVPGIGLVSGSRYPYARLELFHGLDRMQRIGFDPRDRLEVLLTRFLLREQYPVEPGFVPIEPGSPGEKAAAPEALDGRIVTGPEALQVGDDTLALDLGREWFELTLRPMIWGLFATLPGTLTPDDAYRLQQTVRHALPARPPAADDTADEANPIRLQLDETALLGLEGFVHTLFFTGALDEIPELRFTPLPGDELPGGESVEDA